MEKKHSNLKIFAIILLSIGICLIIISLLFVLKQKKSDEPLENTPTKKYSSLLELAKELHADGSYLKLPKDEEKGIYYMTFDEYKKRGYNLDIVDSACSGDVKILNFNIDQTEKFNLFYVMDSCNELKDDDPETVPETTLVDIANELYENNEYLNLTKGDGGYYMTIGMYKSMGYDINLINPECSDDSGVLFFDIDNKEKYETNPVFAVYECNQPK